MPTPSGVQEDAAEAGAQSWEFRLGVAREVGQFLRNSLEGNFHGPFGRDKIRARSRIYLLIRDWEGRVHTKPVKIYRSWRSLRPQVEREGSCGGSIFVGLPSERECKGAIREAGFSWPAAED